MRTSCVINDHPPLIQDGDTALDIAKRRGYDTCVALLQKVMQCVGEVMGSLSVYPSVCEGKSKVECQWGCVCVCV